MVEWGCMEGEKKDKILREIWIYNFFRIVNNIGVYLLFCVLVMVLFTVLL